ncbi:DUF2303 family protein [Agromyces ramosus]|uniref:Uncharacterized protein YfdQ (DUF2303 family) n=1 Tax=Agromyces ramosus TaxID=33879 RepID=A0ABU0R9Q1_9MICO|nr:DUF2303 family protein [Agromyces ramosus]MDQ0894457.1 uncharacterized protein YfdQ (DUF2303 family) [Agromyces ramosus]
MSIELEAVAATTEAGVVADLAQQAIAPSGLDLGEVYALPDGHGGVRIADTDQYAETPRRPQGKRVVLDAASFVAYVNRHVTAGTEVYADTPNSTVRAVIDSHEGGAGEPGWQSHKLDLSLEHTKAWRAWVEHDLGQNPRGWFGQQEFAEFIEDRALDVVEPDHGALIDIATTFEAKQKADFASAVRTDSGAVQFAYTETVAAKAGQKGTLEIPKVFRLALRPYIGGPIYYLTAQFRYRISGNGLLLGYALERPENILEAAFSDIVTEIRDGKTVTVDKVETREHDGIGDVPIFYGRP